MGRSVVAKDAFTSASLNANWGQILEANSVLTVETPTPRGRALGRGGRPLDGELVQQRSVLQDYDHLSARHRPRRRRHAPSRLRSAVDAVRRPRLARDTIEQCDLLSALVGRRGVHHSPTIPVESPELDSRPAYLRESRTICWRRCAGSAADSVSVSFQMPFEPCPL